MLGLKINHVRKSGHWWICPYRSGLSGWQWSNAEEYGWTRHANLPRIIEIVMLNKAQQRLCPYIEGYSLYTLYIRKHGEPHFLADFICRIVCPLHMVTAQSYQKQYLDIYSYVDIYCILWRFGHQCKKKKIDLIVEGQYLQGFVNLNVPNKVSETQGFIMAV